MKKYLLVVISICSLCAALAMPLVLPAQNTSTQNLNTQHHHYKLIQMGTFGGPTSSLDTPGGPPRFPFNRVLNSAGAVLASGDTPIPDPFCFDGCQVNYAFLFQNGVQTNLGVCRRIIPRQRVQSIHRFSSGSGRLIEGRQDRQSGHTRWH